MPGPAAAATAHDARAQYVSGGRYGGANDAGDQTATQMERQAFRAAGLRFGGVLGVFV